MKKRHYLHVAVYLFFTLGAVAQTTPRQEVLARMHHVVQYLQSDKPVHIHYSMHVQPVQEILAIEAPAYTHQVHYYKAGQNVRLLLPDSIEVLRVGPVGIMVDHKNKEITVGRDTSKLEEDPLSVFPQLADSAKEVKRSKEGEYEFLFGEDKIYKRMQMGFDLKKDQLSYVDVEMQDDLNEAYKQMRITYKLWDFKWKPSKDFLLSKYIVEKGAHFKNAPAYTHYKLIDTTLPTPSSAN